MLVRQIAFGIIAGCVCFAGANGAPRNLSATAPVSVTSETSVAAKNIALDKARRQIISDTLGQYSDKAALAALMKETKNSELTNLIASTGIDGERMSDTTYAANITMVVDGAAAAQWLNAAGVRNWLPDVTAGDQIVVIVQMNDRVANWMDLNRLARAENIDLNTKNITGNQVTLALPVAARAAFVAAARASGWRYADDGGALRIWK